MTQVTFSGFPRIGRKRELKHALESFWSGKSSTDDLLSTARTLRAQHWQLAHNAGVDSVPCNDFSLYDHVLDTAVLFDAVPDRYRVLHDADPMAGYFAMARGYKKDSQDLRALEMTKWFDTNYHYIVPELHAGQRFSLVGSKPLEEFSEARGMGLETRPVLLGPITFLLLSKTTDGSDRLALLDALLPVYAELLERLDAAGAGWVQLDEPCLATDLDNTVRAALQQTYVSLAAVKHPKLMVANYFGPMGANLVVLDGLPIDGVHADLVRGVDELDALLAALPANAVLSAGVIDGRNVWRSRPDEVLTRLERARSQIGTERLWIAPSCSLLHVPIDLAAEATLDPGVRASLAFARQKLEELRVYADAIDGSIEARAALEAQRALVEQRAQADGVIRPDVRHRLAALSPQSAQRPSKHATRLKAQRKACPLPLLPTTTIGSFPQTNELRKARADHRAGGLDDGGYDTVISAEIERCIRFQERLGLDVLVHGEAERNDMVEYFGEQLAGFAFTRHGWVQSYGSRCVKPPLIFGDVAREHAMTVRWSSYAQSLTDKPVKGMLTGPTTMLQWSFVRDDIPRETVCRQIALALRDEVCDLEAAGIHVIQIDEPAFREGLPLKRSDWKAYLAWAVECFRIAAGGVCDDTQIHSHMCYSEFNDIIEAVAAMDADVISIECSRSHMELLDAFVRFRYPNSIGPGVYDIHSPRVPAEQEINELLNKALEVLNPDQVWVNPDCGLKTRSWKEVEPSLMAMVDAARHIRERLRATPRTQLDSVHRYNPESAIESR